MMRAIASLSVLILFPALASPEETLRTFSWKERGEKADHVVVSSDSAPRTVTILTISDPGVQRSRYAIEGQVRYEGVVGVAYLEMWNFFPQARYFSRTLDVAGPLRNLQGSSDWRPFVLPFYNKPGGPPPQHLVVNVVLPGRGMVEIGPLRLVQFGDDEDPLAVKGAWWSGRIGGLVGGLTGGLLGCLGALVGVLGGLGKGRRVVMGLLGLMLAIGAVALALGVVAVLRSQPYAVFYPLLLVGILCSVVPLFSLRSLRRRYEEVELRRMRALDAR
jgi:hypothetical protein